MQHTVFIVIPVIYDHCALSGPYFNNPRARVGGAFVEAEILNEMPAAAVGKWLDVTTVVPVKTVHLFNVKGSCRISRTTGSLLPWLALQKRNKVPIEGAMQRSEAFYAYFNATANKPHSLKETRR
jgi:hypothetical protein